MWWKDNGEVAVCWTLLSVCWLVASPLGKPSLGGGAKEAGSKSRQVLVRDARL